MAQSKNWADSDAPPACSAKRPRRAVNPHLFRDCSATSIALEATNAHKNPSSGGKLGFYKAALAQINIAKS